MKKIIITIVLVAVLLGGFLIVYQSRSVEQNAPVANQTSQQTNNSETWQAKTDDQASVTIVITPLDLSVQSAEWKFNIIMDTHSVELNQDMIEVTVLSDDSNKEYRPIRWEGTGAGGHHREGVLIFNQIMPAPKSIELKISDIGDVARSFTWRLQ